MGADRLTATVVGGGIAGLASAASLLQAGWTVTVLERAEVFGEVGAGLAITRNGMAAADALGVGDAVRATGYRTLSAGFQDQAGRWLLRVPDGPVASDSPMWVWAVHRRRLHTALLEAAARATLVTAAQVTRVHPGRPGGEPATVTWRAGGEERTTACELVVAADGVRSAIRSQLFPGVEAQYGGNTSWRAVINDRARVDDRFVAVWGPQAEFGALRISVDEVYWYGYLRHPANASFDDELEVARQRFSDWPAWVSEIVAATSANQLMRHDVYHLPRGLPTYVRGRVVMVGDAAHAFLPTAGQGAATSLEDGVCVGRLIAAPVMAGADFTSALATYDRARRPRCRRLARTAVMIARVGPNVPGGWRQSARNTLFRLVPARAAVNAGSAIVGWTPPSVQPPPAVFTPDR